MESYNKPMSRYYYFTLFTSEETEVQRGKDICPGSQAHTEVVKFGLKLQQSETTAWVPLHAQVPSLSR